MGDKVNHILASVLIAIVVGSMLIVAVEQCKGHQLRDDLIETQRQNNEALKEINASLEQLLERKDEIIRLQDELIKKGGE